MREPVINPLHLKVTHMTKITPEIASCTGIASDPCSAGYARPPSQRLHCKPPSDSLTRDKGHNLVRTHHLNDDLCELHPKQQYKHRKGRPAKVQAVRHPIMRAILGPITMHEIMCTYSKYKTLFKIHFIMPYTIVHLDKHFLLLFKVQVIIY